MRRHLLIQQTVAVDAINGISPELAALDVRPDRFNEVETFVLEVIRSGGGKHEKWLARMTVSHEGHLDVQILAEPGSCAAFH
jgi:hypothetical protein